MKFTLTLATVLVLISLIVQPARAQGGSVYTVQSGDTLSSIAYAYGITAEDLLAANGLTWGTWVFEGQQLLIPSGMTGTPGLSFPSNIDTPPEAINPVFAPAAPQPVPISTAYNQQSHRQPDPTEWLTVQPGDTLFSIASQYGMSVPQLAAANGLNGNSWVYSGQQLVIPTQANSSSVYNRFAPVVQPQPQIPTSYNTTATGDRWIDVDLTNQTITAYEGQTPVYNAVVSTGTWKYPTVVGTYKIYVKYEKARMRGGFGAEAYDLPDVPYVMYFHKGYGLHGTYWHNNFGTPMSHGCVNLTIADAEWFFNWASIGTRVVTHY